jgi:hypothetical protein
MRAFPALSVALLLLAGVGLAGCSGGKAPPKPVVPDDGLQATATTGVLRGVVVDQAIRPLANATVVLAGTPPRDVRTKGDGTFGFDGLAAGSYLLKASKLGYFGASQTAQVVAGLGNPDAVKMQLVADPQFRAYSEAFVYDGFIECTSSAAVLCGAPNVVSDFWCQGGFDPFLPPQCLGNITNDRFTFTQFYGPNMTMVQAELVWESTQAASPELFYQQESLTQDCNQTTLSSDLNHTGGPSPQFTRIHSDVLRAFDIGPKCGIYYSVFAGDATGDPSGQGAGAGVAAEQRFKFFIHSFYGYEPPADWRFSADSTVPPPPQ